MAYPVDFPALTLPPLAAQSSSEVIFKKTFESPELEETNAVITDITTDKYIPILGRLGMVGKANPGSCANNDITNVVPVTEKMWEPKLVSFRIVFCQDELPDKLQFWKKARIAANTWEEVDGELMTFIEDQAIKGTKDSIRRLADFGDKLASPVGDALGSENLTAGTDKGFFNIINGLWQQVFTDQSGAAEAFRYTIPENALLTKVLQDGLAADRALKAMRACYDGIAPEAFEGQLAFQMTRSLFQNWQAFLEDQSLSFMLTQAETKGGITGWSYRGIPIVVRTDWDKTIRTYKDLGLVYELPHRLILADKNIIPIGTSDTESMSTFKSHFDQTTEKHYIKVAYKIDMKLLLEGEIAVAY